MVSRVDYILKGKKMGNDNDKKTTNVSKLPTYLSNALQYAETNKLKILNEIQKFNLQNFDDALALNNMVKVIDAKEQVKNERRERRNQKRSIYSVLTNYEVIISNEPLSGKLLQLIKNISKSSALKMQDIKENFLKNKIEDLNEILLSNKSQNDEILQIVNIVNKSIESNKNSSNSLFVQIASKLSLEELENIIKEKNSIKEKIKTDSDAA